MLNNERIEQFKLVFKYTSSLVNEFIDDLTMSNNISRLHQELLYRVIEPLRKGQEIRDDYEKSIFDKIDKVANTLDKYVFEYKENNITKDEMRQLIIKDDSLMEAKMNLENLINKNTDNKNLKLN